MTWIDKRIADIRMAALKQKAHDILLSTIVLSKSQFPFADKMERFVAWDG